jgi:hypothetical protein
MMADNKILEDALDQYFPDADISIFPMQCFERKYQVSIVEKEFEFACFSENNFLSGFQSKNDCFEVAKVLSKIVLPKAEDLELINPFIKDFYQKSRFNKICEKFNVIAPESMYTVSQPATINFAIISNMSDMSTSLCRIDKINYSIFLNCNFKLSKNREILPVPTLSFFSSRSNKFNFEVAFNIKKQTAHLVKSYPMYYDDFFEENMIFNFDTDLDNIFENFINENVMPHIDPNEELGRQLTSLGDDIETKIRMLLMYSI